jgi:hypothetical protein
MNRFVTETMERAVKTFFQTLLAVWAVAENANVDLDVVTDYTALKSALAATIISVVTSIASKPLGGSTDSASAV